MNSSRNIIVVRFILIGLVFRIKNNEVSLLVKNHIPLIKLRGYMALISNAIGYYQNLQQGLFHLTNLNRVLTRATITLHD